ncbi:MAG: hypothetical protein CM1200mP2_44750 [Planctomycetaceae bacterium]|nr:MAG: hypothetical protein CM1200mP2_44750 [Planctomycetaceae bacterium]
MCPLGGGERCGLRRDEFQLSECQYRGRPVVPGARPKAAVVAQRVRDAVGQTPYVIKIGHMPEPDRARELLNAVAPHIDGIAMTNSVATTVRMPGGEMLFDGASRGICGKATREASLEQTVCLPIWSERRDWECR